MGTSSAYLQRVAKQHQQGLHSGSVQQYLGYQNFFIYIIRYRAGLVGRSPMPKGIRIGSWVVAGFMVLNTLGNLASVNAVEKFLFAPLTLVLAIACFVIAASKVGQTNPMEEGIRPSA